MNGKTARVAALVLVALGASTTASAQALPQPTACQNKDHAQCPSGSTIMVPTHFAHQNCDLRYPATFLGRPWGSSGGGSFDFVMCVKR